MFKSIKNRIANEARYISAYVECTAKVTNRLGTYSCGNAADKMVERYKGDTLMESRPMCESCADEWMKKVGR